MRKDALSAVLAIALLTVVLGLLYPLAVTGVSQLTMPGRADGSLVHRDGRTVGSALLAQDLRRPVANPDGSPRLDEDGEPVTVPDPRWFQPRPSVTGWSGSATSFSNAGPNAVATRDALVSYRDAYLALERPYSPRLRAADVPVDAATDSASGVDPTISVANARIQARRIAAVRRLPLDRVLVLVADHVDGRDLGVLGEPGVNVLRLNLALDRLAPAATATTTTTDGATR
ncbi:potassium-transporting ATPase subunit C [Patulibacter brassicae]|jgi:K+-transporting ATPase ATPase C chain|uniref:Potassium-transporting ATPase KdpC subunit n=1 Tax=Patulibacter brassicae TaxID=1705717 RepID=A0ABU4VIU8_9ACTN|nr:potassium-transporting ATPase subunit C [Patulibacter brassicae]MDX8151767.1 potassium-transporting ATPase subunit C [Patulibacter brassicae]